MKQNRMGFTQSLWPLAALFALSISWSLSGCFTRVLQEQLRPLQQLSCQAMIALTVLSVIHSAARSKSALFPSVSIRTFILLHGRGFAGGVIGVWLLITGYRFAPVAHMVWLQTVPVTAVWSYLLYGERVTKRQIVLLLLGSVGIVVMANPLAVAGAAWGRGEVLGIVGHLLFSFGLISGRGVVTEIGTGATARWTLLIMSIYGTVGAYLIEGVPSVGSPATITTLVVSGVVVAANSGLSLYGFAHTKATVATSITSLESIWAPLFAFLLFREQPSIYGAVGGGIVLLSALGMSHTCSSATS